MSCAPRRHRRGPSQPAHPRHRTREVVSRRSTPARGGAAPGRSTAARPHEPGRTPSTCCCGCSAPSAACSEGGDAAACHRGRGHGGGHARFASGALGTIEAATSMPGYSRRIELTGSEGTIVIDGDRLPPSICVGQRRGPRRGSFSRARGSGPHHRERLVTDRLRRERASARVRGFHKDDDRRSAALLRRPRRAQKRRAHQAICALLPHQRAVQLLD